MACAGRTQEYASPCWWSSVTRTIPRKAKWAILATEAKQPFIIYDLDGYTILGRITICTI
jgi:hypothetical protein